MSTVLQQIIESMYIDPELLEQLGDDQKQILFRKIREEQVRRWKIKENELEDVPPRKKTPQKVGFLVASDGNPWVWVMGEHKDDVPYDEIVQQRELHKQEDEKLAEIMEAEKLTKKGIISVLHEMESVSIADSPRGTRQSAMESFEQQGMIRTESQIDTVAAARQQARQTRTKRRSLLGETPEERSKFEKEQVAEVLGTLRRTKSIAKKRAEEMAKKLEDTWRESKRRADMYDRSRKRSFKIAQEIAANSPNAHRRILDNLPAEKKEELILKLSSSVRKPARPAPPPPKKKLLKMTSFVQVDSTPKSAAHVVRWFRDVESPKGVGKETDGSISVWFHGKIGRETAVRMLEGHPIGSYLVRLSAKLWGYTVSVKTLDDTRHFLIDASTGQYSFLGPKQQKFKTLLLLLEYYNSNPITWDGQEILLVPVALEDERDVYGGLYSDDSDDDDGSLL